LECWEGRRTVIPDRGCRGREGNRRASLDKKITSRVQRSKKKMEGDKSNAENSAKGGGRRQRPNVSDIEEGSRMVDKGGH